MAGKYLRGALIEFTESVPIPIPNVILFQFNPETMSHSWTPAQPPAAASDGKKAKSANKASAPNPLAVGGDPGESFSFDLRLDAYDMIADGGPVGEALGTVSGVYTRLAALEMLLYPTAPPGGGLIGSVSSALGLSSAAAPQTSVPSAQLPAILFVWGPGRILPVKVSSLSITETLYDTWLLHPIQASVKIELKVLTREELAAMDKDALLQPLCKGAYEYSHGLRQALAIANLANGVGDIIGMLPI